jgi:hypothetical protein
VSAKVDAINAWFDAIERKATAQQVRELEQGLEALGVTFHDIMAVSSMRPNSPAFRLHLHRWMQ